MTLPDRAGTSPGAQTTAPATGWRQQCAALIGKLWLRIAVLLGAAFIVHVPSLQGQLIWDDSYLIGESPFFRSPIFCLEVFRQYLFLDSFSDHYRPVQNLSYMLDYLVWNGNLYGYHLSNTLWHAGAGVLLFLLLRKLFAHWSTNPETAARLENGAFLVALIWAVHPAHSAAVDYISGRADSLAFVFSCGAWLTYLRAVNAKRLAFRAAGYGAAALLLLLGLCSREIAFVWAAIFVAHLLFVRRSSVRHRAVAVAACLAVVVTYAALRQLPGKRDGDSRGSSWGATARAGLMLRALGDYARLTVYPTDLHMERTVVERSMFEPGWRNQFAPTHLTVIGLFTGALLILGAFKRGAGRSLRRFGAAWFVFGFLPISNVVELNATAAEHWLYLPLAGLLMVALGWMVELRGRVFHVATACVLLAACALGVRSTIRSSDWLNAQVFYERTITAGGWSPRVAVNLAIIYGHQGQLEPARKLLERSLQSWPDYPLARSHLGVILARQGKHAESDQIFAAATAAAPTQKAVYPRTWTASIQFARRAVSDGRDEDALRLLAEARQLEPKVWQLAQMESEILRRTRGPEAALPVIQQFAEANWWQYSAYLALGKVKAQQGDAAGALAALQHASRLDIRETEALNLMARIQMRANNTDAALLAQRRAVARQPDEPSQHRLFAEVLRQAGRDEQAQKALEAAKALEQRVSA
jgi:protein O-mannosyl-transferase